MLDVSRGLESRSLTTRTRSPDFVRVKSFVEETHRVKCVFACLQHRSSRNEWSHAIQRDAATNQEPQVYSLDSSSCVHLCELVEGKHVDRLTSSGRLKQGAYSRPHIDRARPRGLKRSIFQIVIPSQAVSGPSDLVLQLVPN